MTRIHVSLNPADYELVKKQAAAIGIFVTEFIRRAVRESLIQSDAAPSLSGPAWMRYAGFVGSGDSRLGQSIDDLVYGMKD